ncbi:MAG: ABC transporter substrate-binding protein, partial [Propionicimonas sp.]|nr:ABC transporter substrate-binding protein [Propionicimonas sp.]
MRTSHPRVLGLVVGAAVLLGASACSPAAPAGSPSAGATATSEAAPGLLPAAEGRTTFPLTLTSPWGETVLEKRPERIATVTPSQDDVESVVALGGTPAIASEWATDAFIVESLTQEIPLRFTTGDSQFPVEQIAAAKPDLIIALGTDLTDDYDKLASIAPVLAATTSGGSEKSVAATWEDNLRRIGEALDLQDAAEAALQAQDDFFTDFRAQHPEFAGLTATYVVYYGAENGLQYHSSPDGPATWVFEQLGFAENPRAAEFSYRQAVSNELLSKIDADIIILSDNSDGNHAEITGQPLFQSLSGEVVIIDNRSADGVFVIDGTEYEGNLPWALARSGPLSATWAARQLGTVLQGV